WARQALGSQTVLQGNLDPVVLMLGGPALDRETDAVLAALQGSPFIFNLGHGVLPQTPPEHVGHVVDHVRSWQTTNR
ncbi:MAG: uroporphyrinogen decarboxylase, partial [Alphaproteobacteria bacterium]|nr:uroporphyrinogen decarboxylase [Alphaproteobacteria bacterium]